jgi:kynurenine formamidase
MRYIDLSTPIVSGHFRWAVERKLAKNHPEHRVQATWAGWIVHGFTHMDSPRHFDPQGFTTDGIDLDMVIGTASVVDVRKVGANAPITEAAVRESGGHIRPGDIVLMRAGWDQVESIDTPAFWANAPWVTREAAEWLKARKIKGIAYDFPQDHCIREFLTGAPRAAPSEYVTHDVLLRSGIVMFEYLCNMMAIEGERTFFVGLPLKVPDSDGAPMRAIAIEGMPGNT